MFKLIALWIEYEQQNSVAIYHLIDAALLLGFISELIFYKTYWFTIEEFETASLLCQ